MVTCGLCGGAFVVDRSQAACRTCPLAAAKGSGCGMVRCPACGYENPRDPLWITALRGWLGGRGEEGSGTGAAEVGGYGVEPPADGPARADSGGGDR